MSVEPSLAANIQLRLQAKRMRLQAERTRFQADRMRFLDSYQTSVINRASSAELIENSKDLCLKSTQLIAQAVAIRRNNNQSEKLQVPNPSPSRDTDTQVKSRDALL